MTKLFAVPFSEYQSSKTEQGMIYNLIDENSLVHLQCRVAHKKYASHDLCLHDIPGAPTNVKNKITEMLDDGFGKGQWQVITRFSVQQTNASQRLSNHVFNEMCQCVWFDEDHKQIKTGNAHLTKQ